MSTNPDCRRCPLGGKMKRTCIPSDGPPTARLLVLGEAPGADEDDVGKPFVGMSGRLLRAALAELGLEYRIGNTVRCRPPDNRKPLAEETAACRVYLDEDIAEMRNLEVIVTLGDVATRAMGLKGQFMKDLVGVPHYDRSLEKELVGVIHDQTKDVVVPHGHVGQEQDVPDVGEGQPKGSRREPEGFQSDRSQGDRTGPGEELVRRPERGYVGAAPLRPRGAGRPAGRLILIPLAHPAYVLRNHTYLDTWRSHWAVVRNALTRPEDPARRVGVEINDRVVIP